MSMHEGFNRSGLSRFINSVPVGRLLRLVAGAAFLTVGYVYRSHTLGVVSMAWSVVPLTAGVFDLCWVSAILGGPLASSKIRSKYPSA